MYEREYQDCVNSVEQRKAQTRIYEQQMKVFIFSPLDTFFVDPAFQIISTHQPLGHVTAQAEMQSAGT